jgi:hypothetical protein
MNTLRTTTSAASTPRLSTPLAAHGAALALALVVTLSIFSGVTSLSAPSHAGAHLAQVTSATPVHS